ncbi:MAG: histidine kinase [Bacteroidota bacterium]
MNVNSFKFNTSDYLLIGLYFVVSSLWLLFRYDVEEYSSFQMITGLLGALVKTAMLLFLMIGLIQKYLALERNYLLFFVLTLVGLGFFGFLDLLRDYYTADPKWQWNPSFGAITVDIFYRTIPDVALPLGLILGKKYYEDQLKNVQIANANKELELKVLRSQYDPHFLYNNLNTIDAIIDYSPKHKVKEYVGHLAALYRNLIQYGNLDVISLEEELRLAKHYFYLIRTRFEGDYAFTLTRCTSKKEKYLPNGALLTILENVVTHNKAIEKGTITTQIEVFDDHILICNTRGSTGIKKKASSGTGLANLKKRYHLLSEKRLEVRETDKTFSVILPLLDVVH